MKKIISIFLALLFIASALAVDVGAEVSSSDVFEDVKDKHWFKKSVDYVLNNGLMNGMTDTTFAPNTNMSRGMLVTVLWRYEGSPSGFANNFKDIPAKKYYTNAVCWAGENGIVNGVADRVFDPDGDITREQLVTIMYRYTEYIGSNTSGSAELSSFSDASKVSKWATAAMKWAVAEGIISGTTDGHGGTILDPKGKATRAQVATVLMRYCSNSLYVHNWDAGEKVSDPTCTEKGEIVYRCLDCEAVKRVAISALGHIKTQETVTKNPTCTEKGNTHFYCTRCGQWADEPIDELGHSWKNATCTAPKTCTRCGVTSGKALGHKYGSGKVTKEPTCTATGTKTYTCTRCGHHHDETIKAKGHKTDAPKCSRCGHNNRADAIAGIRQHINDNGGPIVTYSDSQSSISLWISTKSELVCEFIVNNTDGSEVLFQVVLNDKDTLWYVLLVTAGGEESGILGDNNMQRKSITSSTSSLSYTDMENLTDSELGEAKTLAATMLRACLASINAYLKGSPWTVHTFGFTAFN